LIFFCDRHGEALAMAGCCFFIAALLMALPVVYGRHQLQSVRASVTARMENPDLVIPATLVQGNFSTKERWSGMGFYQRVLRYLEMSEDKGDGARRVIVWPENTLNVSSKLGDALFIELMRGIGENALLIAGGLQADADTGEVFNSAYFISGAGRLMRYDKQVLLPYSETSPLIDLLDAYYTAPSEFTVGKTTLCMACSPGPVGPSICFEILYSGLIRESVKIGARYLVNLSNDSWFGESPMPWMHLNAARLRAIENRRFLLRAATSGISAIIGPDGQPVAQSRLFVQERVDADFVDLDDLTFYTQYGDWVLFVAAGMIFAALARVVVRNEKEDF
jgi:apolipoprotein N-acyltransferase